MLLTMLLALTPQPQGAIELWGGIAAGAPKGELESKYESPVDLGGACKAKPKGVYEKDRLKAVFLLVSPAGGDSLGKREECNKIVTAGLITKYGAPVESAELPQLGAFKRIATLWQAGRLMIFTFYKIGPAETQIKYELMPEQAPRPDVSDKL